MLGYSARAQSFYVIVNKANPTNELSANDVSNFFLKKNTKWSYGQKIIPVDLSPSSSVRANFSAEILHKTVKTVQSYWQRYVFAGKGTPPVEKRTETEVVSFIKRNSGAIGYVSTKINTSGVKIVTVK